MTDDSIPAEDHFSAVTIFHGVKALLEIVDAEVSRVTLVAVAFDSNGNVVGMRRVEQEAALTAGAPYPFAIEVFSTGGVIATVEVYAEAEN